MSSPDGIEDPDTQQADRSAASNDAWPGVAVDGYPGLRAGAFGYGDGALGVYQVPDGPAHRQDPNSGFQTVSWRDSDPEAINYDLYQKQRQLKDAQVIGNVLSWGGNGQTVASAAAKAATQQGLTGLAETFGALAEPYTGMVGSALGQYMDKVETPRLQSEIKDLQARQKQFGRSGT